MKKKLLYGVLIVTAKIIGFIYISFATLYMTIEIINKLFPKSWGWIGVVLLIIWFSFTYYFSFKIPPQELKDELQEWNKRLDKKLLNFSTQHFGKHIRIDKTDLVFISMALISLVGYLILRFVFGIDLSAQ